MLKKIDFFGFIVILAQVQVLVVFLYLINVVFFYPSLDGFFKASMVFAGMLGLFLRCKNGEWGVGHAKPIVSPFFLYAAVVIVSFYFKSGFSSTIEMMLISLFFLYGVIYIRLNVKVIVFSCVISSIQMLFFILSQDLTQWQRLGGDVHPIFFAFFAFLLSVICFYISFSVKNIFLRFLLWVSSVVFVIAVVLTQTRGVLIAYIPVLALVLSYLYFTKGWRIKEFFMPIALIVIVFSWSLYEGNVFNRFTQMFNEIEKVASDSEDLDKAFRTSIGHRLMVWSFSWDVAKENPIFGVGNERYQELKFEWSASGRYPAALAESLPGSHAHSQYFQEMALRGAIGFISLITLFAFPFYHGVKLIRSKDTGKHYAAYMLISIMVAFSVFSLSEVALKHPDKIAMFVIFNFLAIQLCHGFSAAEKRSAA